MVTMVVIFYEVRLSRTCFLISRRRSKPQCGSDNLCNPFARSAGIFLGRFSMFSMFSKFKQVKHVKHVKHVSMFSMFSMFKHVKHV